MSNRRGQFSITLLLLTGNLHTVMAGICPTPCRYFSNTGEPDIDQE